MTDTLDTEAAPITHAGASGGPVAAQYRPTTEALVAPTGVDAERPRLAWGGRAPAGAELVLLHDGIETARQPVGDGEVAAELEAELRPLSDYRWRLEREGATLVEATFSTGLRASWPFGWIEHGTASAGVVAFRTTVEVSASGVLWLMSTALGVYELSIDGESVLDEELAPGWTDYAHRVRYRTTRLTLDAGSVELEARLAPGWYSGHLAAGGPARYGTRPALSLGLLDSDGTVLAQSDGGWMSSATASPRADLVMGQTIHSDGERSWAPVTTRDAPDLLVETDPAPPVRVLRTLECVWVTEPEPGIFVADFGINLVGRVRVRPSAIARELRLLHGEELEPSGRLYRANLRSALQEDELHLAAGESIAPTFTVHGFRYVEMHGWRGPLDASALVAEVLGSDLEATGELRFSDPAVTALVGNIERSVEGNVLSVPTDCPQRDERLGWTADISVFAPTLTTLRDGQAFLGGWLRSVVDGQRADGAIPHVAPTLPEYGYDSPVWSDTIVHLPWLLWRRYGDRRVLRESFDAARRWVDYCRAQSPDGIRPARALGDWLAPGRVTTPGEMIATGSLAHTALVLSQIAGVLGEEEAEQDYALLAADTRAAFAREFVRDGQLIAQTQTASAMAISWNLLGSDANAALADRLAEIVRSDDHRLTTGFIGTPLLLPALSRTGHHAIAARLFNQEGYPSWRYQVRAGATTMWERWDSWHHARGFQTATMNSFNHYAYGCVGQWLTEHVAGIGQRQGGTTGGFTDVTLTPRPIPLLREARARYRSAAGTIESGWRAGPDGLQFAFAIPAGVRAAVELPVNGTWDALTVNGTFLMGLGETIPVERRIDGAAVFEIGSGRWTFTAPPLAAAPLLGEWDAL